jgi:hypothetical protein
MANRQTNVEIGTVAAQFPEKEYINGIFLAVWGRKSKIIVLYRTIPHVWEREELEKSHISRNVKSENHLTYMET